MYTYVPIRVARREKRNTTSVLNARMCVCVSVELGEMRVSEQLDSRPTPVPATASGATSPR